MKSCRSKDTRGRLKHIDFRCQRDFLFSRLKKVIIQLVIQEQVRGEQARCVHHDHHEFSNGMVVLQLSGVAHSFQQINSEGDSMESKSNNSKSKLISTALNSKSKVNDVKSIDSRSKLSTASNLKLKVNDLKSIDSKSKLKLTASNSSTQSSFS